MADKDILSTNENQGEIVIYQTDDGDTKIDAVTSTILTRF